jgi:hypothetical protein
MSETKQALVVTTSHKGVFFGYGEATTDKTIRLEQCRMCIYWSSETKGVVGLASDGPAKGSRISPATPAITIQDVTSCMEASPEAVKAWEKGIWE